MTGGMRAAAATLVVLVQAIALAGCMDVEGLEPVEPLALDAPVFDARETPLPCGSFCEPTVAASPDGATLVVLGGGVLAVSRDDGRTFEERARPPIPQGGPPGGFQNDALVQYAPDGRLYFSALVTTYDFATRTIVLAGVQVAASEDDGDTWTINALRSPATTPTQHALGADRQWLAFGPQGEVYLTYHEIDPALNYLLPLPFRPSVVDDNVLVARSDDGGRTFSSWTRAFAAPDARDSFIAGRPVVDADGALHLGVFRFDGDGGALWVTTSRDGGRTFTHQEVGPTGNMFPTVATGPDGALHVAMKDPDGAILLAHSADGAASWSEPARWNPGEDAVSSPWVEGRPDGTLDVVWLQALDADEGVYALRHARGSVDAPGEARTISATFTGSPGTRANTDFAHFAHVAGARVAALHGDADAGAAFLVVETTS